jgi:hypothetical protein
MAITALPVELCRKANEDDITPEDGLTDFALPILPGGQFFLIQPCRDVMAGQALI